jgi:exonuclease SbcD
VNDSFIFIPETNNGKYPELRILHTSDWHLGKKLDGFTRLDEQKEVMDEICRIADEKDVHLVVCAGDIFDVFNPPAEATELFYRTVKRLSKNGERPVIIIAGNHDMPERIEAPDPLARECGILFSGFPNTTIPIFSLDSGVSVTNSEPGYVELNIPAINYPVRLLLTPYANEFRLRSFLGTDNPDQKLQDLLESHWKSLAQKHMQTTGVNLLAAHLFITGNRADINEDLDDERPINHLGGAGAVQSSVFPEQLQYAMLGHIHIPVKVADTPCPVKYCGSPLPFTFDDRMQDKCIDIISLSPDSSAKTESIKLTSGKKLVRGTFDTIEKASEWLQIQQDNFVELTIVTKHYLNTEDKKLLHSLHPAIIHIIPELTESEGIIRESRKQIDLGKSVQELFSQYYESKFSFPPDKATQDLFQELMSIREDEGNVTG